MAIISISRGTKSGGETLAQCLADRLGYPLLGREGLQEAAAHFGGPAGDLVEKMEDPPRSAKPTWPLSEPRYRRQYPEETSSTTASPAGFC